MIFLQLQGRRRLVALKRVRFKGLKNAGKPGVEGPRAPPLEPRAVTNKALTAYQVDREEGEILPEQASSC